MNISGILVGAAVVLLAGASDRANTLDLAQWQYRAEVTIEKGEDEYCRLKLTPEVYNVARRDLGDIRLVGAGNEQIPYVLAEPRDTIRRQTFEPAVINRSTSAQRAAMVTLDFADKTAKNSIEVVTAGNNFRRAVKVEGSNDNVEFFTLVEQAYVFAVSFDKRFEQVDLPNNDYRYLRICVSPMEGEQDSPVIGAVKAFRTEPGRVEQQPVKMVLAEQRQDDKNRSSIYIYDLAYRSLPVTEIELDVADEFFYRYVTIEGRDAATQKVLIDSEDSRQRFREVEVSWERILGDAIYRYIGPDGQKHERLVLRIPPGRRVHRFLKVEIQNYDDKPVSVRSASAKMAAHEIVFESKDSAPLLLYVGSESAGIPQYDLKQRLSDPLEVGARTARLAVFAGNPLFKQSGEKTVSWTEKHKALLLSVMAGVALVLGLFILKSFKSIQTQQAQGG